MDNWKVIISKGILPGTLASLASTAALAWFSRREAGSAYAGANAISHWLWGDRAFHQNQPTLKYTLVGYGIHHASAHLWGSIFEQLAGRVLGRKSPATTVAASAAATAVACFVDYQLTPKRLQPGFEQRISRPSLALVYVAFGLGLAAGAWANHRHDDAVDGAEALPEGPP